MTGGAFNKRPAWLRALPAERADGAPRNLLRENLSSVALRARESNMLFPVKSFQAEFVTNSTSS